MRQHQLTPSQLLELKGVLEERYEFETRLERMDLRTHPQVQAAKRVADLVFERDDPEHLLIVYYSGHGFADEYNRLLMHGSRQRDDNSREMCIDWIEVEAFLGKARADVLVILDCCFAGILASTQRLNRSARRKFQYIAACEGGEVTISAGKESFSRAIIEAFRSLAKRPGFMTSELVRTLTAHEDFPRDDQKAVVFDSRFGPVDGDIWLAPSTEQAANTMTQESRRQQENDLPTAAFLDLRFCFAEHATDSDVEATAEALKRLVGSAKDLRFHKVSLLRRKSHIAAAVQHWRDEVSRMRGFEEVVMKTVQANKARRLGQEAKRPRNAGLLDHVGRLVSSVLLGCGAVPAWHDTPFVRAW